MDLEHFEERLEEIRHLLSHLHGEVTSLEEPLFEVLQVLRSTQEIIRMAERDDLTGLLRRNEFDSRFQSLLNECRQHGENCGLLMIDIDHFKAVNDAHGHLTGDEVLRRVSQLLKQFESPRCFVGRYGGEEFVVAIRGSDAEILGQAEMIRRGTERLHGPTRDLQGGLRREVEWKCTLSVGMASARKLGYDATRLLHSADRALYEAKRRGRNQVRAA